MKPTTPVAHLIATKIGQEGLERSSEAANAFVGALAPPGGVVDAQESLMGIFVIASSVIGGIQEQDGEDMADAYFGFLAQVVGEAYVAGLVTAEMEQSYKMDEILGKFKTMLKNEGDDSDSTGG